MQSYSDICRLCKFTSVVVRLKIAYISCQRHCNANLTTVLLADMVSFIQVWISYTSSMINAHRFFTHLKNIARLDFKTFTPLQPLLNPTWQSTRILLRGGGLTPKIFCSKNDSFKWRGEQAGTTTPTTNRASERNIFKATKSGNYDCVPPEIR